MSDIYLSIRKKGQSLFRDKGSKFIGLSFHINDETDVYRLLDDVKKEYHDARHHCYAYILGREGNIFKVNDDGEPNHSAGDPILGQIRSRNLTNTLVIVVRYFGGTKLGVSGLINAYKIAANDCLEASGIKKNLITVNFLINYEYDQTSYVLKLLTDFDIKPRNETYEQVCSLEASVPLSAVEAFKNKMQESKERNWLKEFNRIES